MPNSVNFSSDSLDYRKKIKIACENKMHWIISAVPLIIKELGDVHPQDLCDYMQDLGVSGRMIETPQRSKEEALRHFTTIAGAHLLKKTSEHFYTQNPEIIPSPDEYRKQLEDNLAILKKDLLPAPQHIEILHQIKTKCEDNIGPIESKIGELLYTLEKDIPLQQISEFIRNLIWSDDESVIQKLRNNPAAIRKLNIKVLKEWFFETTTSSFVKSICYDIPIGGDISKYIPTIDRYKEALNIELKLFESMIKNHWMWYLEFDQELCTEILMLRKEWQGSSESFYLALERTRDGKVEWQYTDKDIFMRRFLDHLRIIANENEILDSLSMTKMNPKDVHDLVKQVLRNNHVDDPTHLVSIVVRDLQHVIEHTEARPSRQAIARNVQVLNQFVVNVRSACNRAALVDLYNRLLKITPEKIADSIISDWDIIGSDIRDSTRLLSETDKLRILEYASGRKTKEVYEEEMSQLQNKLERQSVNSETDHVVKLFPNLGKKFPNAHETTKYLTHTDFEQHQKYSELYSEQRSEHFALMLKRSFIHQQLSDPDKFRQNPHEAAVFAAFGMNPGKIKDNIEQLQQKIRHVIQHALLDGKSEADYPEIAEMQQQMELLALRERIATAGGEPSLAPVLCTITKLRKNFIELISEDVKNELNKFKRKLIQENKRTPQHLEAALQQAQSNLLRFYIKKFDNKVKRVKHSLAKLAGEPDLMTALILPGDESIFKKVERIASEAIKAELDFFNEWYNPIQYENIQGHSNLSDVLGDGVCQANTYRLISKELSRFSMDQKLTDKEWRAEVTISRQDRFLQAFYATSNKLGVEFQELPGVVLKRLKLKEIKKPITLYRYADDKAYSSEELFEIFSKVVEQKPDPNKVNPGIVKVSIQHHTQKKDGSLSDDYAWGHAVFLRYDAANRVAYFYDPSHGRSVNFYEWALQYHEDFKEVSPRDQDNSAFEFMIGCFSQLIAKDYPDVNMLKFFQPELDVNLLNKPDAFFKLPEKIKKGEEYPKKDPMEEHKQSM